MGRQHFILTGAILFAVDCLVILLTGFCITLFTNVDYPIQVYTLIYLIVFLLLSVNFNVYSSPRIKKYDLILSTVISCFIASLVTLLFTYFTPYPVSVRIEAAGFYLGVFVPLSFIRLLTYHVTRRLRGTATLLVIENESIDNALARKIKYSCLDWFDSWYTQIDTQNNDAVQEFIKGEFSEYENIFITQSIPQKVKDLLVAEAIRQDKNIYMLPSLYDINITKYQMVQFDDTPSFLIKPFHLTAMQRIFKRFCDLLFSTVALLVASPFMLIIALCIKFESKGPVLYTQDRVTQNNKVFRICKFRTMGADAEKLSGPVLAKDNDDRITKVGRFLRLTRLDELPQVFNILKGEMSLVGPRPERPFFVEQFCSEMANYDKRLAVKAGLTGYAQVYARYDTDAADKLLYDLLYIREYSILLDLKIMLLTIKTVFTKEASEGVKEKPDWSKKKEEEQSKV